MKEKYSLLISNTAIFAIGSLLVKIISFFLMPLYTSVLTAEEYGISELLSSLIEIAMPIATFNIVEALYRFSIDEEDYEKIFTNSILLVLLGDIIIILLCMILYLNGYIYSFEFAILYCSTSFYKLTTQFARGMGQVKNFSFYGILNALILVISNIVLLLVLNGGISAYLMSFSIAYGCSAIVAFILSYEYRFINIKKYDVNLMGDMMAYSVPGIPNMLSWWINSVSDRYIILYFCGPMLAGVYTAASKLPALINFVTSIFQQAWQYSTAKEINKTDSKVFFSKVFQVYSFVCIISALVLVMLNKFICKFLLKSEFYIAWEIVPILLLASTFGCYSTYFGTFYNALKNNKMLMISTLYGAIVNFFLNIILIPLIGGIGAAIATVVSYGFITVFRLIDIQKRIGFIINYLKVLFQIILLVIEVIVSILFSEQNLYIYSFIALCIIMLLDFKIIIYLYRYIANLCRIN